MAQKKKKPLTLLKKLEQAEKQRNLEKFSKESSNWYRNKVRSMGGQKTRDDLIKQQTKAGYGLDRSPGVGFMYTFIYDAKHKDTLPYWDAFPLILLVGPAKGGFYGLNFHYLSPKMRAIFMDKIMGYMSDNRYNNRTKIQLSYGVLKSAAKLKMFKPMFKRYLSSHVASKIVKIPSQHWESALYLPTANFQKSVNSKVWMQASKYK
jgi:hypothetical protein